MSYRPEWADQIKPDVHPYAPHAVQLFIARRMLDAKYEQHGTEEQLFLTPEEESAAYTEALIVSGYRPSDEHLDAVHGIAEARDLPPHKVLHDALEVGLAYVRGRTLDGQSPQEDTR